MIDTSMSRVGKQLEPQRPGNGCRFDQADGHGITKTVALPGMIADQRMPLLPVAEIFHADGARRNKAIRPGIVELYE
jgi:hypothetical protein